MNLDLEKKAALSDFPALFRGLRAHKFRQVPELAGEYNKLMRQHAIGAAKTVGKGLVPATVGYAVYRGLKPAAEQTARAQDYMRNTQHDLNSALPSMTVTASYEKFASEKLSGIDRPEYFGTASAAVARSLGDVLADKFVAEPIDALQNALTKKFHNEPAWNKNFQSTVQSDPMLSDIHKQNPEMLHNAFQTIKRFSPSLAKDRLATRSLLRHVAMSGGEMDFGTMKMLAETEKFHNESKR